MAARPFPRLSTDPIIAWTVNGGSTPTIGPITLVKGDAAVLVADLNVRIMYVAPDQPTIARQMSRVSGMGAHPGPQVLHSARGGKRGTRTNRGGGRWHGGATPSPVCLRGF